MIDTSPASTGVCTHHNTTVGALAVLLWGAKGAKDANLPITKGPQVCHGGPVCCLCTHIFPQNGGEKGPRGKI